MVAYDQFGLYLYIPRILVAGVVGVLFALAVAIVSRNTIMSMFAAASVFSCVYLIAPFGFTTIKSFYLDCARIEIGQSKFEVSQVMGEYSSTVLGWNHSQPESILEASASSQDTPYIYVPGEERYDSDFCMVYLREDRVERVVISPD